MKKWRQNMIIGIENLKKQKEEDESE